MRVSPAPSGGAKAPRKPTDVIVIGQMAANRRLLLGVAIAAAVLAAAVSAFAIIGGADAPRDRYPWVAQIELEGRLICGGSLLGGQWIITAGHCVTEKSSVRPVAPSRLTVRLGSDVLGDGARHAVERAIPYPGFAESGGVPPMDLALLQLTRGVHTTSVSLVPSTDGARLHSASQAFIAGWGSTKAPNFFEAHPPPAMMLKDALVHLRSDSFCVAEATERPYDPLTQLCSTESSGETCHGDSGGPLFADRGHSRAELLGVIVTGHRYCKPGHPNIYSRLWGGPLRRWLDEQLRAAKRSMASCPDLTVRGPLATVTVRRIRANVGCDIAKATAVDVTGRDDCVEETPGGVNECEAVGFACATRLEDGPAGVAFVTSCEEGMRRIRFRQGAAHFARGPRYRLLFGSDGRPTAIGPFDIALGDRSIRDMIAAFGPPDSLMGNSEACTVRWDTLGLKAYAVDYGTSHACNLDAGYVNAVVIVSPRFITGRGLAVGVDEDSLLARYPHASTRAGDGAFDNELPIHPGVPGDTLYAVHLVASPIGFGGVYASLKALVEDHRVIGLEVTPLLGGD
jgi:hypothetical protein